MYFDDYIAHQIMRTNVPPSSHYVGHADSRRVGRVSRQPVRRLLGTLWSGVRQVAWGIDAFSSVRHGIDVPPDHGARSQLPSVARYPRP